MFGGAVGLIVFFHQQYQGRDQAPLYYLLVQVGDVVDNDLVSVLVTMSALLTVHSTHGVFLTFLPPFASSNFGQVLTKYEGTQIGLGQYI